MTISRRVFLAGAAGVGAGWLLLDWAQVDAALAHAAHAVQQRPAPPFTHLAPDEAAELAAVAARILPTTDTPGATEAGVIYFIDRALGAEQRKALPTMRAGITDLRRRAARRKPGTTTFAALPAAHQVAILAEIEQGEFFQGMRCATMVGMFGDPSHGGNRGGVGWKLLGFEHRASYEAPFGYYDAEAARRR